MRSLLFSAVCCLAPYLVADQGKFRAAWCTVLAGSQQLKDRLVADLNMTKAADQFLPTPIMLPSGVMARIALNPMPKPDERGRYKPRQDCDIQVSLYRDDNLIESRRWDTLICGESNVVLVDGTTLSEDDLDELDSTGWDQMMAVGLVPGSLVG